MLFLSFTWFPEDVCMKIKLLFVQCPWFLQSAHHMKSSLAVCKIKVVIFELSKMVILL